ncbi:hypothetical protein KGM_200545 [Danaus plexippus plexippus]|uniref:ENTH domain-containing protein n=1 Tax=Danaus plexippus plexippus TaxID=278856 RepID=A0A212FCL1_DANPL|nr:hypothetical protein KGM_200545 [Danaus plexippus plexippus]
MDRFISMWKVRELADKVTNVVMNYTEVEGKVREATSDEAWGPTGQQMQELALATFTYEHFPEVMSMLWRRMLHDNKAHWRRTYKCLLLLSYLVRNGSERVVTSAREHIYDLRSLENYSFVDDLGKDQGINIRHKVRELIDFIQDDDKLRDERKKAKKNKDKYIDDKDRNEDDYDREDSDGDDGHTKHNKENVYRDSEVIDECPVPARDSEYTSRTLNISLRSPARNKQSTPVKKIDLGAAANYGKTPGAPPAPAVTPGPPLTSGTQQSQELLDELFKTCAQTDNTPAGEDDFDPRHPSSRPVKNDDFGDFSTAFSGNGNDEGFADFTSAFHNNNTQTVSAPTSNLQLLSELSPAMPSLTPGLTPGLAPGLTPALDPLSSHFDSALNITDGDRPTHSDRLRAEMKKLVNILHVMERIKSEGDVADVNGRIQVIKRYLPGPVTVQKLSRCDSRLIDHEALEVFSQLLGSIVRVLLPHWPEFRDEVVYLFTVEEGFDVSNEILTNLCGYVKEDRNDVVLEALGYVTLKFAKSDAVLASIIDCSVAGEDVRLMTDWEGYVQLLTTLPERIANRLEIKTPIEFSHENYSFILLFQVIRSVDYMCQSNFYQGTLYNLSYLSYLVSKYVVYYIKTEAVLKLCDMLIAWTDDNNDDPYRFVRRKLIQTVLNKLSRQAIDKLALILLKRCPIVYSSKIQPIKLLLGNNLELNKDWHEILTFRIPFYVHPQNFRDTTIPENLVYYIATTKNALDILTNLIVTLAKTWADVHLNNVINIDHHMHTSVLLVLAIKYRIIMWRQRKGVWNLIEIKRMLYKGMSKHLDILTTEFRCVGMATVEIVCKMLVEVDDSDRAAVERLNFEFNELGQVCVDIYNTLVTITNKCVLDDRAKPPTAERRLIDAQQLMDVIAEKVTDHVEKPVQNTIVTCAVKGPQQTKEIVKTIISAKLDALKGGRNLDLDSDDDLQPYDMTNDVSVASKKKPNYLRDLLEVVREAKDQESFEAALTSAENLVKKQLKHEDGKLAIELLDLFVHLEEKYHVDKFKSLKFNTAVAIVCSQPRVCAEHLCKEVHSDIGRYSISTKIFMLDVFTEAAERIADIKTDPSYEIHKKAEIIIEAKELPRDEVLRRRLLKKTKFIHSKRAHPFSKAKKNQFAPVSDYFFYPLIAGFGYRQLTLSHHNLKQDIDNLLLLRYLSAVGSVVLAAKNCPKCPVYCREILQMVLFLRFTPHPELQLCVISIIAAIALALPQSMLKGEFYDVMMELCSWVIDLLTHADLSHRLGGPKSEATVFAGESHVPSTLITVVDAPSVSLQPSLQPCRLQPNPQPIQPSAALSQRSGAAAVNNNQSKLAPRLGATWADSAASTIIDVDNLLSPRSPKAGPAPSINQLKSNPASPAHRPAWPVASNSNNNNNLTTDDLLQ